MSGADRLGALADRPRARFAFLTIVALLLSLPGFFTLPPTDRDESRFAQASKQMIESGDYIDIRFQEDPRHKKPAGIYWLQSGAASLFGGPDAPIWAYRLPSLLGAALAVALTAWALAPLIGAPAATLAALMLAFSVLLQVEARIAKTDAALLSATVAAMGAMARAWAGVAGRWREAAIFWTAMAAGVLLKGPIIFLAALGPVLWIGIAQRRFAWLGALRPLPGLVWFAVLALPWFVLIALRSEGSFFAASVGEDMLSKLASGQESHGAPPGYYAVAALGTFWPAIPLVLMALPVIWRRRREAAVAFLLGWAVPLWLVFELTPTKLPHYTLPAYPALAGLAALMIVSGLSRPAGWRFSVPALLGAVVAFGLPVGLALLPVVVEGRIVWSTLVLALGAIGAAVVAHKALWQWRLPRFGVAAAIGAALCYAAAFGTSFPALDRIWISPRIEAATRALPCPAPSIALYGYHEPSIVFLTETDTTLFHDPMKAYNWASAAPSRVLWLALQERDEKAWSGPPQGLVVADTLTGFNLNGGDALTLRALTQAGGRCAP